MEIVVNSSFSKKCKTIIQIAINQILICFSPMWIRFMSYIGSIIVNRVRPTNSWPTCAYLWRCLQSVNPLLCSLCCTSAHTVILSAWLPLNNMLCSGSHPLSVAPPLLFMSMSMSATHPAWPPKMYICISIQRCFVVMGQITIQEFECQLYTRSLHPGIAYIQDFGSRSLGPSRGSLDRTCDKSLYSRLSSLCGRCS